MPYDRAPNPNPFSREYKYWVEDIARSVNQLEQLKPLLQYGIHDSQGGSNAINVFPASVVSRYEGGTIDCGKPFMYRFDEIKNFWDHTSIFEKEGEEGGGREGLATNLMEYKLCTKDHAGTCCPEQSSTFYVPPGTGDWCLGVQGEIDEDLQWAAYPIGGGQRVPTIVLMVEFFPEENIVIENTSIQAGTAMYYFSVPPAYCVFCRKDIDP